jgi:hypothetical protein
MSNCRFKLKLTIIGAVLLVSVVILQALRFGITRTHDNFSFGQALGLGMGEWRVVDLPLGSSEQLSKVTSDILRFDAYIHKQFSKRGREFDLFVATYAPRSVPVVVVAQHTPDQCWPTQGWRILQTESNRQFRLGSEMLPPGEWRTFRTTDGQTIEVVFWHTIAGRSVAQYDQGRFSGLKEAFRQLWESNSRQFFVRISSRQPLGEMLMDAEVSELLRGLMDTTLKI